MKIIKKISLSLILVLGLSNALKCQMSEQIIIKLDEPNKPSKLDLDLFLGTINVVGYAGKEVIINATGPNYNLKMDQKTGKYISADSPSDETKRAYSFDFSQRNNLIQIKVEKPNIKNFEIKVPYNCSIIIKVTSVSEVIIENVKGNHEIALAKGNITMTKINGSVLANTVNGNIIVQFKSVTKDTPLSFTNVGGIIDITLPESLQADVQLKSEQANIYTNFELSDPKSTLLTTDRFDPNIGLYKMPKGNYPRKINGGGLEIMVKSVIGNIYLRKAK